MRGFLHAIICLLVLAFPLSVQAQSYATLIADDIAFDPVSQKLEATGGVEILHGDARLKAQGITYDRSNDSLQIDGPLYLVEASGTVIRAEFAELSGDLREGVISGARLVYDQQLQLAAVEIRRTGGRFTQFYKTVASSCQICDPDSTPLWEIRARRIVHDAKERQLYFDNASLRVAGIPVFYTPYLRLPDPSVERSTGFLVPELKSNGDVGFGLRVPYFITLGDHADLTLTPWITSQGSNTLETRYRRKFTFGDIEVNGAITEDNLTNDRLRGYVFADGRFDLPLGFSGRFDIEAVSDPGYLLLYGYSDKDRLDSALSIDRIARDEAFTSDLIHIRSLRDDEDNRTLPTVIGELNYEKRFTPRGLGGIATFRAESLGYYRRADEDLTLSGLARDVLRVSASANWRKDWQLSNGMLLTTETLLRADYYEVQQDARLAFSDTLEITPFAALEWRWPMLRESNMARHLLEPVAQIVLTDTGDRAVANEDSLSVEFDEANLFEFSRFPGVDAQEKGRRINLGLTYTREDVRGWSLGLTVGRVIRDSDQGQFSVSTGLRGKSSEWLLATQLEIGDGFDFLNRAIFDDALSLARNEARVAWTNDALAIGSSYVWLEADTAEGRPTNTSEISLDGAYRVSRHWTLSSDLRYDFVQERAIEAGLGASYQNECARVDLSLSRRFTSSTIVTPVTEFSLSVQLAGFGATGIGGESYARKCNG